MCEYRGAESTQIDKVEAKFTVEEGVLYLDEAIVSSKVFDLLAKGSMNYLLAVDMQTKLHLSVEASQAVSEQVKELGYLMDEEKRIAINAGISGTIPKLSYKPDVDLKRIGTNALVEEGSKQLQKVIEQNPEVGAIINDVLGNFLK